MLACRCSSVSDMSMLLLPFPAQTDVNGTAALPHMKPPPTFGATPTSNAAGSSAGASKSGNSRKSMPAQSMRGSLTSGPMSNPSPASTALKPTAEHDDSIASTDSGPVSAPAAPKISFMNPSVAAASAHHSAPKRKSLAAYADFSRPDGTTATGVAVAAANKSPVPPTIDAHLGPPVVAQPSPPVQQQHSPHGFTAPADSLTATSPPVFAPAPQQSPQEPATATATAAAEASPPTAGSSFVPFKPASAFGYAPPQAAGSSANNKSKKAARVYVDPWQKQ